MKKTLAFAAIEFVLKLVFCGSIFGAYQTTNFVVHATSSTVERQVATQAEQSRKTLAVRWLGRELPTWRERCPIHVAVNRSMGAGGSTSFNFDRGRVYGWHMRVQGPLSLILRDVVPHEVNHTVFASHFRRPLPRWADEGAATYVEGLAGRQRQNRTILEAYRNGRIWPLRSILSQAEYPRGGQAILRFYSQGFSMVAFLIEQRDEPTFVEFVEDAFAESWAASIRRHYGYRGIDDFADKWKTWLVAGGSSSSGQPEIVPVSQTTEPATDDEMPELWVWSANWCSYCNVFWNDYENDVQLRTFLRTRFNVIKKDYDSNKSLAQSHNIRRLPAFDIPSLKRVVVTGYNGKRLLMSCLQKIRLGPRPGQREPEIEQPEIPDAHNSRNCDCDCENNKCNCDLDVLRREFERKIEQIELTPGEKGAKGAKGDRGERGPPGPPGSDADCDELKAKVSNLENQVADLKGKVKDLQEQNQRLQSKLDGLIAKISKLSKPRDFVPNYEQEVKVAGAKHTIKLKQYRLRYKPLEGIVEVVSPSGEVVQTEKYDDPDEVVRMQFVQE